MIFERPSTFIARHTEYGRVFSLLCVSFFCLATDISAVVQPIVMKFCAMVELCLGCAFLPFGGNISVDLQM